MKNSLERGPHAKDSSNFYKFFNFPNYIASYSAPNILLVTLKMSFNLVKFGNFVSLKSPNNVFYLFFFYNLFYYPKVNYRSLKFSPIA